MKRSMSVKNAEPGASPVARRKVRAAAVFAFVALAALLYAGARFSSNTAEAQQRRRTRAASEQPSGRKLNLGVFPHDADHVHYGTKPNADQIADCKTCHTIEKQINGKPNANMDVTDFPDHDSCLRCHEHRVHFYKGARPQICTICHTQVSPRNGARFDFPRRNKTYDYTQLVFPHDKHVDNPACNACHKTDSKTELPVPKNWSDDKNFNVAAFKTKSNFQTYPTGHSYCVECHATQFPVMDNCAGCHAPAPPPKTDAKQTAAANVKTSAPAANAAPASKVVQPPFKYEAALLDMRYLDTPLRWKRFKTPKFKHDIDGHERGKRYDSDEAKKGETVAQCCATCHTTSLKKNDTASLRHADIAACWACHGDKNSSANAAITESVARLEKPMPNDKRLSCSYCHFNDIIDYSGDAESQLAQVPDDHKTAPPDPTKKKK